MHKKQSVQEYIVTLLERADIRINGTRSWDIHIHQNDFYRRLLRGGSLAFGESYMDGWWEAERLDLLVEKLLRAGLKEKIKYNWRWMISTLPEIFINTNRQSKAFEIGQKHYDIGNDLYQKMLDKKMVYTCAYWKDARTLDEAQEAKLDLVCKKIGLKSGQHVLDIGCGWGSFAKFAAERYGAEVTGVTVSREQKRLGDELCRGLPVEIRLQDYRELVGKFDHIVSLGMFEHVGVKNYRTYFQVAGRCLKDDGLFLLQTIGFNWSVRTIDPWMGKYIFPKSVLPSIAQIARACEKLFVIEDIHNFGVDYAKTTRAWFENFDSAWSALKDKYDERFYRMWKFYLLTCVGMFNARYTELWQIVLSKKGVLGGYESKR